MVKVMRLLIKLESALGLSFGVRAQTEIKIRCWSQSSDRNKNMVLESELRQK